MITVSKIRKVVYLPLSWLLFLLYLYIPERDKLMKDLRRSREIQRSPNKDDLGFADIYRDFMAHPEFRSVFWFRFGRYSKLVKWLFPKPVTLLSFDIRSRDVGGGLLIQHGHCTEISAKSIGENCWINQKVTIGYLGPECPTLGDNVRIGVGAIILGGVHIGNNVNIGAGAVVVKDVPDNTTVVGQPARYLPRRTVR